MRTEYGLPNSVIDEVAKGLGVILADSHVLYVKTLNYHWNLDDPRFFALHRMLDEQYHELAEFVDEVAERLRQMGRPAPASLREFLELSTLKEGKSGISGDDMLRDLAESHEAVMKTFRRVIDRSTELGDFGTADMLNKALRDHEKAAWFLRAHL
jgi:starvation-inducible DNA-binding protein